jgi:HSP90 family molecular chaperone
MLSPTRDLALRSPYYEPFLGKDIPVVILNIHIDEMVFKNLGQHKGYTFINIENEFE